MLGDGFCQKLFCKVYTFIWLANKVTDLKSYPNAVVEGIFNYRTPMDWVKELEQPTKVPSYYGYSEGYVGREYLQH